MTNPPPLPLAGYRVVEFTHMVMGPACGLVLGDLGAEVIKVEPPKGDNTRRLGGAGAGFFPMGNRNKKSIALDVKDPRGLEIVLKLVAGADVFSENFKEGALERLGLGRAALTRLNPRLVYVSHKGFLPGPYDNRTALDEVVQMMGGLAYMTGPEGRPLRAGASVNDIMGGVFGALGALAMLLARDRPGGSGEGGEVQSALFENNIFLMAQHMMQFSVSGRPAAPMPGRLSAWGIYDVFSTGDGSQIFLAVVTDTQWRIFCETFGLHDLLADPRLATNNSRVKEREWMMPRLRQTMAALPAATIAEKFEANGLPFAPIARPHDLFDDLHLLATGGLADLAVPADASCAGRAFETRVPLLPITLDGARPPVRLDPPALGEHTRELLTSLGYAEADIESLRADGVVGAA